MIGKTLLPSFVAAALFLSAPLYAAGEEAPPPPPLAEQPSSLSVTPTLEEKIGQMVMAGFSGFRVDKTHPIAREIEAGRIGGVILFDRNPLTGRKTNIESPAQLRSLTAELKALSKELLLIAIDCEGGRVNRLKEEYGFNKIPSHAALGERDDPDFTRRTAFSLASTLGAHGINLNMAPVVDLAVNPENPVITRLGRSFSAEPAAVTRHALPFMEAHRERGVLPVIKHFPGHGSSKDDSHLGMTDVTESWRPDELEPFRTLISDGKADAVMTAHVFNRKIDPDYPATLSRTTLTGILRYGMGYDGVVISDDMQMKAITSGYGLEKAVVRAVDAGVDILLFSSLTSPSGKSIPAAVQAIIKKAVAEGRLSGARIDESHRRITALKARLTLSTDNGGEGATQ